jgi:hypothetical protein
MRTFKEQGVSVVAFIEHWVYIGPRHGWRFAGIIPREVSDVADPIIESKRLCNMWRTEQDRYKLRDREPFGIETKEQLGFLSLGQLSDIIRKVSVC